MRLRRNLVSLWSLKFREEEEDDEDKKRENEKENGKKGNKKPFIAMCKTYDL